jgi:FAD/FMN-containing dehydrogenase
MSANRSSRASPPVASRYDAAGGVVLNDLHSGLNPTRVHSVIPVASADDVQAAVWRAAREGRSVSIMGGRHAMGAQQFATDGVAIDTRPLCAIGELDVETGRIVVDAGVQWPGLVRHLVESQSGARRQWGIAQKQTGADRLSIGGALAANVHGRGLTCPPFVADVEAFSLVDAAGEMRRCSRTENGELFSLVIGGYGLFGIVTDVTLRLVPRHKVRRVVEVITADRVMAAFDERIAAGFEYGDFQFALDPTSPDFLHRGIFSCYMPADPDTPIPSAQRALSENDWRRLLRYAHADKAAAWDGYSKHYLATSGQVYWSDTHQLSTYIDGYHEDLDRELGAAHRCSEIITEIYVPRARLGDFLAAAADDFRRHNVDCIYGTVRLIERDQESFLAWAREPWACTIFNLHTEHTPAALGRTADAFRRLIDMAVARGGSYYLTYHKYATREQLLACYPQFPEFLRLKQVYDREGRFQSDWYRHHAAMLGFVSLPVRQFL